jgi:hypothetical protein
MLSSLLKLVATSALLQSAIAAPAIELPSFDKPTPVVKRQDILEIIESIETEAIIDLGQVLNPAAIISELAAIVPTATPTDANQALSLLSAAYATATPTGFIDAAALVLANSLSPTNVPSLLEALQVFDGIDSDNNPNNPSPSTPIYPQRLPCDAPYSVSEAELRRQIYIPSTFTYGRKPPVILFPGTGGRGGQNFLGNFEVLLANVDYADLVWVNPTNFLLGDAQKSAELAAYTMNYISAVSGNVNVSIIAWSQGNINIQWANKYWPSTRSILSDHIAVSPDYHGTILADLIRFDDTIAFSPSVLQQQYNSNFITTLRSFGGDSAYVPTTNIYTGTYDEIVEPQQNGNASAILNDVRGVGVTNAQVQLVCGADSPAGLFQTHESMLANSLSAALAIDALTHPGPGLTSRVDLDTICQQVIADGLSFENFLETEEDIVLAGLGVLSFFEATELEPAISAYALVSPTGCGTSASSTSKATTLMTSKTKVTKTKTVATTSATKTSATTTSTTKTSSTKLSATKATKTTASKTSSSPVKSTLTTTTKTKATKAKTTSAPTTTTSAASTAGVGVGGTIGPIELSIGL